MRIYAYNLAGGGGGREGIAASPTTEVHIPKLSLFTFDAYYVKACAFVNAEISKSF